MLAVVVGAGCAGIPEGREVNEAYRKTGHKYLGRNMGRGGRQRSKVMKSVRGIARYELLDDVMREDSRRRRAREQGQGVAA